MLGPNCNNSLNTNALTNRISLFLKKKESNQKFWCKLFFKQKIKILYHEKKTELYSLLNAKLCYQKKKGLTEPHIDDLYLMLLQQFLSIYVPKNKLTLQFPLSWVQAILRQGVLPRISQPIYVNTYFTLLLLLNENLSSSQQSSLSFFEQNSIPILVGRTKQSSE